MKDKEIAQKFCNLQVAKSNGYAPLDFSGLIPDFEKPIVYTRCFCCGNDMTVLKPHYSILDNTGNRKTCVACGDIIANSQIEKTVKKIKINPKQIY